MTNEHLTRRDMLKKGTMAAAITLMNPNNAALDYEKYDGLGLADLIRKKQIMPLELLNAVRAKAEALNPKINALCHLFFDKAEAQIKAGVGQGAFAGVPFVLKDLGQQMAGTITSAGSRVFKDARYNFDSTLVERYKKAGLVIFGKTTSPELGLTTTTESVLYGKTRNPWNLDHTSGGSSGGTSALVAARILPFGHASDGGGSIRVPASCCGLFGLKPTRGRVPLGPMQFEGWGGASVHHAITISVRDSAALLDASVGTEPGSPFFSPVPARPFLQEVGAPTGKLKIALVVNPPSGSPLDPECKQAVLDAAKLCESLGHHVTETKLPIDPAHVSETFLTVFYSSIARVYEDAAKARGRAITQDDVELITWASYQNGLEISAVAYARAVNAYHQIGLQLAKFQEPYDVILSPVLAQPPVKLGVLSLSPENPAAYGKAITEFSPYTALYNVTGQPSMSVPLHWTKNNLPVGVMFSGRFGDDATLLRLAAQLEKAQPWAQRKPNV